MIKPQIIVKRHLYEEPEHIQLEFIVSNGLFCGNVDIYCNANDLKEIGQALRSFPTRLGDEYVYEYGSENPDDRYYRYFLLRAYTVDSVGHSAIQFAINCNQSEPNEGACRFSIRADVAAINRLGELFEDFGNLVDFEFIWTPTLSD